MSYQLKYFNIEHFLTKTHRILVRFLSLIMNAKEMRHSLHILNNADRIKLKVHCNALGPSKLMTLVKLLFFKGVLERCVIYSDFYTMLNVQSSRA